MFTENPEEGLNYIVDATCKDKPKIGYVSRVLDRVYIRFMSEAFMESIMTDKDVADTYRFKKVPPLNPNEVAEQVRILNKNSKERRLEELREEIRLLEEEEDGVDFPSENPPSNPLSNPTDIVPQICFPTFDDPIKIKQVTPNELNPNHIKPANPEGLPHA